MKCWLWMGLFLIVGGATRAQTVTVSDEYPVRNNDLYEMAGVVGDHVLLYRNRVDKHELIALDANLQGRWEKKIELLPGRNTPLAIQADKQDFNLFYLNKDAKGFHLLAQRFDPEARPVDTFRILSFGKSFNSPTPQLNFSRDENKLVVKNLNRDKVLQVAVFRLDSFRNEWTRSILLDEPEGMGELQETMVTNSGRVLFFFNRNNYRGSKEEHYLEIFELSNTPQGDRSIEIPFANKLSYDLKVKYDEVNDQVVVGGFFSDHRSSRASGYFYLRVALKREKLYVLRFTPFSEKILEDILAEQVVEDDELESIQVRNLVLRRDGGVLLIGEITRTIERYMPRAAQRFGSVYSMDFYHDDLLLFSIHPDGETHWEQVLYKKQYSMDDFGVYSSFFLAKTSTNIRLIFNDEIKFENTVSEYLLDAQGNIQRNSVMSTDNQKIRLRFLDAIQISSDEILVPSDRRNRLKVVKITY